MQTIKIPYARRIDNGKMYSPVDAEKNYKYICDYCKEKLMLKKGDIKIPHFCH